MQKKKWNWQQENWLKWEFDSKSLQKYEDTFLLQAWKLSWALEYLLDEEKQNLEIQLLSDEAIMTSKIEGEYLDRDSVQSSIKRKFWLKTDKSIKAAESGIAELMMDCFQNYERELTHEVLFLWHEMICSWRRDLQNVWDYRTHSEPMQVVSWEIDRPKIHFQAPPSAQMYDMMSVFLSWLQNSKLPILTKTWIAHLYFISIHPFEDGNGRIVRAICEYVMSHTLQRPSYTTLSRQIEIQRKQYYTMLEKNNKSMKIQSWLEWFCETVIEAQKYALELTQFTIQKTKIFDRVKNSINERQEKVLIRMFEAGPDWFDWGLSAANYIKITKATIPTTTRDLQDLVQQGVLMKTWERKSTRYWLKLH